MPSWPPLLPVAMQAVSPPPSPGRSGMVLRSATAADMPAVVRLIQELAACEREPAAAALTVHDLVRDGFPPLSAGAPPPAFYVILAVVARAGGDAPRRAGCCNDDGNDDGGGGDDGSGGDDDRGGVGDGTGSASSCCGGGRVSPPPQRRGGGHGAVAPHLLHLDRPLPVRRGPCRQRAVAGRGHWPPPAAGGRGRGGRHPQRADGLGGVRVELAGGRLLRPRGRTRADGPPPHARRCPRAPRVGWGGGGGRPRRARAPNGLYHIARHLRKEVISAASCRLRLSLREHLQHCAPGLCENRQDPKTVFLRLSAHLNSHGPGGFVWPQGGTPFLLCGSPAPTFVWGKLASRPRPRLERWRGHRGRRAQPATRVYPRCRPPPPPDPTFRRPSRGCRSRPTRLPSSRQRVVPPTRAWRAGVWARMRADVGPPTCHGRPVLPKPVPCQPWCSPQRDWARQGGCPHKETRCRCCCPAAVPTLVPARRGYHAHALLAPLLTPLPPPLTHGSGGGGGSGGGRQRLRPWPGWW